MGILWAYNRDNGDMYMYNNIRVYIYIINYDLYLCIVYYVYIYTYSITTSIYHVFVSSAHRDSGVGKFTSMVASVER